MSSSINVHVETVWRNMEKVRSRRDVVVIVDVLRASTTIVNAFTNGATRVYPVETVDEARIKKNENPKMLLCGERRGLKLQDFDLGNSPLEYNPDIVDGKWIVLTTTDGTRAVNEAKSVQRPVLIGACINAAAVADRAFRLATEIGSGVSVVAAGRKGQFSMEDFLGAGLIAKKMPQERCLFSDAALAATSLTGTEREDFVSLFNASSHAKELREIGLGDDVVFASSIDASTTVPILGKSGKYLEL
jgi:2-phosphosulfolactate phosphatase